LTGGADVGWGKDPVAFGGSTVYLGSRRPVDKAAPGGRPPAMDDAAKGQAISGGETIGDAILIATLPFTAAGESCTYVDNYDVPCSYTANAPDVVFAYTPASNMFLDIDLCGSAYDTKVFVLDGAENVLACNEDFYGPTDPCGGYVSRLKGLPVTGGQTVYIVIDGYGASCGTYQLDVSEFLPCVLTCNGDLVEGEPTLRTNYVDRFNAGCNSVNGELLATTLEGDAAGELTFCGVSGFYSDGEDHRDTDWFAITLGETGEVTWYMNAEQSTLGYILELECPDPGVYGVIVGGPCTSRGLTIVGEPGDQIGLWVAPYGFTPPLGLIGSEYDYEFTLSGLSPYRAVAVESVSWGAVKSRYR